MQVFHFQVAQRQESELSIEDQVYKTKDYYTEEGGLITRKARVDIIGHNRKSIFVDPENPKLWLSPDFGNRLFHEPEKRIES